LTDLQGIFVVADEGVNLEYLGSNGGEAKLDLWLLMGQSKAEGTPERSGVLTAIRGGARVWFLSPQVTEVCPLLV
jgi:hypothetical protein